MLNINEVTICGCLGRDPDLRYGTNNLAFVSLAVATNRRVKNADGQYENVTDWNTVVAFGKTAETIAEYLHKGSPIWVRGRLQTRKYKDKNGAVADGCGSHFLCCRSVHRVLRFFKDSFKMDLGIWHRKSKRRNILCR